jgi:hypothetical protein
MRRSAEWFPPNRHRTSWLISGSYSIEDSQLIPPSSPIVLIWETSSWWTVDSPAWRTRPVNADRDRPIAMDRAELRQGTTIKACSLILDAVALVMHVLEFILIWRVTRLILLGSVLG